MFRYLLQKVPLANAPARAQLENCNNRKRIMLIKRQSPNNDHNNNSSNNSACVSPTVDHSTIYKRKLYAFRQILLSVRMYPRHVAQLQ
jgi:hypothetical protein